MTTFHLAALAAVASAGVLFACTASSPGPVGESREDMRLCMTPMALISGGGGGGSSGGGGGSSSSGGGSSSSGGGSSSGWCQQGSGASSIPDCSSFSNNQCGCTQMNNCTWCEQNGGLGGVGECVATNPDAGPDAECKVCPAGTGGN